MATARDFRPQRANEPLERQSYRQLQRQARLRRRAEQATLAAMPLPAQQAMAAPVKSRPSQSGVVQALPHRQAIPPWLKVLIVLQRTSSVFTVVLIAGLLIVYGWTVYTQQRWGQAYSRLEILQKQERQLMAANEVIKNQMARQAEAPGVGLVLPEPGNTIFLTPAPQRPPVEPEINLPPAQPIPARPLGY